MLTYILVAFEAFKHIVAVAVAGLRGRYGSGIGACTAAADEEYQGFFVYLLRQCGDKIRIGFHARVGHPFNFNGIENASDPVKHRTAAYIDKFSARGRLQYYIN